MNLIAEAFGVRIVIVGTDYDYVDHRAIFVVPNC